MRHFQRLFTALFLTVLSVLLLLSAALVYMIVTPAGGKLLVYFFKQQFVAVGLMHVGHYEGTLHNGFILKDVMIKGLSYLPDSPLRIQEVQVHLPLWKLSHASFDIFNARLFIPGSDPLVFTGKIEGQRISGEFYGKSLDLHEASRFWASEDIRKNLQGYITNADFKIQGPLSGPRVYGGFYSDDIRYKSVAIKKLASRVNLLLLPGKERFEVRGELRIDSGEVNVRKVDLKLLPSKFVFREDVFNPLMDLHLSGKVEDMDFHLDIKGASDAPQLNVSSDPPMPPQDALRTLFSGNAFSTGTSPFNGINSTELAESFLNYSLQDIDENQGFGAKAKLNDTFKVGAEVDEKQAQPGSINTYYSSKINGEMDMSEHMSLNVSRQVMSQEANPSYGAAQPQPDTQVYLQYKKRF